jgi:predicted enzyme related to lactoylglutathione lyase
VTVAPQLGLVLDCRDPESLAPFWADALGYVTLGGVENYVLLVPDGRPGPKLLLQRVPEDKAVKNRMHLDIEVPDIEAVANRLERHGAQRLSTGVKSEHGSQWVLMADPEGNEFCVCDGGAGAQSEAP